MNSFLFEILGLARKMIFILEELNNEYLDEHYGDIER